MPPRLPLFVVLCIAAAVFLTGINWGLPSRAVDAYLFGNHRVWTGQEILDLAGGWDTNSAVAADRDRNPIGPHDQPVLLNGTDAQRAEIVRRYRLFSAQPDEMIQFRALSQIKPGEGKFDPKLYQYGGLWIYPVGALLKIGAILHLVDVRSDLAFYLDHPEAFARFYIVARLYSVAWGLFGVGAVFAIVRRLTADAVLAAMAGLCFAAMPVVITMAHEAKPHLAGAVLMLWAGYAAIRYLDFGARRWAIHVGLLCGAAVAMVPTSAPVFLLLPVLAVLRRKVIGDLAIAAMLGVLVYAITNPYVIIHLLGDRTMLASSAGNTAAMYAIRSPLAGLLNVASLTAEGSGWVIAIGGVIAWLSLHFSAIELRHRLILLAVPAIAVFAIFASVGAGKPGEYGRFLIVPDVVLMIGIFVAMRRILSDSARRWQAAGVAAITTVFGAPYLMGFVKDTTGLEGIGSRAIVARDVRAGGVIPLDTDIIGLIAEPAPYSLPPVDLFNKRLLLLPQDWEDYSDLWKIWAADWPTPPLTGRLFSTRISWADKPFRVRMGRP